jgi:hypothetical protein
MMFGLGHMLLFFQVYRLGMGLSLVLAVLLIVRYQRMKFGPAIPRDLLRSGRDASAMRVGSFYTLWWKAYAAYSEKTSLATISP